jgi:polyisoprenoid-binding protein YceI
MTTAVDTPTTQLTGTYTVDPSHTHIGFVARHAMVTRVRGSFTDVEGNIQIDGDDPTTARAELRIDAASVDTRSEDRDTHLRSADFFDVDNHPYLSFTSTAISPVDDTTYRVTGELTIKDVTREVTFDLAFTGAATDPFGNERIGFEGDVIVNRKDWDLTWNAALEAGGVLVSENVTLEFAVSAIRAA